ncbi:LuxR C-terminal-related transcriptional regulator, partial [Derxia lacustris]|uniref:LuxR C-terminal-related transcriptional regulator n=1 Tax=Derxia lacustris TaxID=764842 RepID=UPI000A16E284
RCAARARRHRPGSAHDADAVAALWQRTEGWVTGLVLAALSPDADDSPADRAGAGQPAAPQGGSNPALACYLADSVLARLPPATVDFLHDAAPFARFSAGLCDALGPRRDSRSTLDWLARQHLFVKPLGDGWYRFHALFAEHLCARLRHRDPAREAELRRRAAHWFVANRHWPEAVAQALAVGDDALAARWAEQFSQRAVETGEVATLAGWLGALPLRLRQRSLRLRLLQAWALAFALDLRRARQTLADIEADLGAARLAADADTPGECLAVAAIIDGLSDRSDAAIARADAALATRPAPGGWTERTALVARTFGLCSAARFAEALACDSGSRAAPAPLYLDVYQHAMRGLSLITAGDLDGARQLLRHALALAEAGAGPLSAAAALPAGYLAEVLHEQGEAAEVAALLHGRDDTAFAVAALGSLARFCTVSARQAAARGDLAGALAVLDRGERAAAERGWPRLHALCLAERVHLLCAAGRLDAARGAIRAAVGQLPDDPPAQPNSRLETWLAWQEAQATLLLHGGHAEEALPWFRRLATQARGAGFLYRAARMQLLLALALDACGAHAEAVAEMAALLPLAERQGLAASFADLGAGLGRPPTAPSPALALRDEARRLVSAASGIDPGAGLSARELDILGHVADGLSNKEIARLGGIAPETVKWHLKNIFAKLAVGSRQEAVRRALLLGLVGGAPRSVPTLPPVRGVPPPPRAA